jgi:hypothetical protein
MLDDPAVMVMAPWYVFAASPAPFTDIVRLAGVVALVGATLSHVEAELTLAVKLVAPLALFTATVWEAGAVPPCVCENDRELGVAVTAPLPEPALTVKVTFTSCSSPLGAPKK